MRISVRRSDVCCSELAARGEYAKPGTQIEIVDAFLLHGRHLRESRGALGCGNGQALDLVVGDQAGSRGQIVEHEIDLSGQQSQLGRRRAGIRHVYRLDARTNIQKFTGKMAGAAIAAGTEIQDIRRSEEHTSELQSLMRI